MSQSENLETKLQQIQMAYWMAVRTSEYKAGFLARTAHELRSPLSSLISLHQIILADLCTDPQEEREFVQQAYNSALNLMQLIDQIVNVSKIESGITPVNIQPVSIAEVLLVVESQTGLQAANRNLNLSFNLADDSLLVQGDQNILTKAIVNLVDGAIALMSEGSVAVNVENVPQINRVLIKIDVDTPPEIWSESVDLLDSIPTDTTAESEAIAQLSPGMKLMLADNLLETIEGEIELVDVSTAEIATTRLQLSLPAAH